MMRAEDAGLTEDAEAQNYVEISVYTTERRSFRSEIVCLQLPYPVYGVNSCVLL